MENITLVGTLSIGKESDRFIPYSTKLSANKDWKTTTLLFNVQCGTNRHMLTIRGTNRADGKGKVFTRIDEVDADGKRVTKNIQVDYADRNNPDILEKVNFGSRFEIDIEKPKRRAILKKLKDKLDSGEGITDEELSNAGLNSMDEISAEYEKSLKRRKCYIDKADFADTVKKVIDSDFAKNKKFKVYAREEYSYMPPREGETEGRVYTTIVPRRIVLADNDEEVQSTARVNFVFGENAVDDSRVESDSKYYVYGYQMTYNSKMENNILPVATSIVIPFDKNDEQSRKKAEFNKRFFEAEDDGFKELACTVDIINGSELIPITMDMWSDVQREGYEFGIYTKEEIEADIRREKGGAVYGEVVHETRFVKPCSGYTNGAKKTEYTTEDMIPQLKGEKAVVEKKQEIKNEKSDDALPFDEDELI